MRSAEQLARQWIAVQRAGNYVGLAQQALVDQLFVDIRRALRGSGTPTQIANAVAKLVAGMNKTAYALLVEDMGEIAKITSANAQKQVAAIGGKGKAPNITAAKLNKWMTASPMASSNTTVQDLHTATYASAQRQARGAVLLGQTADDSPAVVRSRMADIQAQMMKRVLNNGATSTNQIANSSKQEVFKGAKRHADRVMWNSTLDPITSDFCILADGKVFPIDRGPRPPAHPNCRSTILLIGKGESAAAVRDDLIPRPAVEATSKDKIDKYGVRTKKYGGNYFAKGGDDKK